MHVTTYIQPHTCNHIHPNTQTSRESTPRAAQSMPPLHAPPAGGANRSPPGGLPPAGAYKAAPPGSAPPTRAPPPQGQLHKPRPPAMTTVFTPLFGCIFYSTLSSIRHYLLVLSFQSFLSLVWERGCMAVTAVVHHRDTSLASHSASH